MWKLLVGQFPKQVEVLNTWMEIIRPNIVEMKDAKHVQALLREYGCG